MGIADVSDVLCLGCNKEFMSLQRRLGLGIDDWMSGSFSVYDICLLLSAEYYSLMQNG